MISVNSASITNCAKSYQTQNMIIIYFSVHLYFMGLDLEFYQCVKWMLLSSISVVMAIPRKDLFGP